MVVLYVTRTFRNFKRTHIAQAEQAIVREWYLLADPPFFGRQKDPKTAPNGIALSPDEATLYVANSDGANKVWYAYDVLADGTLGPGRVFYDVNDVEAPRAAAGMTIHRDGNLFAPGPGRQWKSSRGA